MMGSQPREKLKRSLDKARSFRRKMKDCQGRDTRKEVQFFLRLQSHSLVCKQSKGKRRAILATGNGGGIESGSIRTAVRKGRESVVVT
jgi:hypothetical protein